MISIITVTYNDAQNLAVTLKSIEKFKTPFQRFYIIDGDSNDETASLLMNFQHIIDGVIIEKDAGIYDAMNKALRFPIADDDYIIWINAGDELLPWTNLHIEQKTSSVLFAGVLKKSSRTVKQKGVLCSPRIFLPYNERNFYPKTRYQHQGFFIKRKIFKLMPYDISIGLQAENLLMSKCILSYDFECINAPVSIYYTDGVSNTKTYNVLKSYINVARYLHFNILKLFFFKRMFFIKAISYSLMPSFLKKIYESKKYCNE